MADGPDITTLTNHLAACPADFLREPVVVHRKESHGIIETGAVVSDILHALGGDLLDAATAADFRYTDSKEHRNHLRLILIACHLLNADCFTGSSDRQERPQLAAKARAWLENDLGPLANISNARSFVTDGERREELVRRCLAALEILPAGESANAARDRLSTLDSIERERVIQETRKAQIRAQKLREEMARKRAEEAASKMMRE